MGSIGPNKAKQQALYCKTSGFYQCVIRNLQEGDNSVLYFTNVTMDKCFQRESTRLDFQGQSCPVIVLKHERFCVGH